MKITQAQVDKILEIMFDTFGTEEPEFRPDYSGRGMYGKSCVGFVTQRGEQAVLGAAIALSFGDDLGPPITMLRNVSADSMGLNEIVYFPLVQLED